MKHHLYIIVFLLLGVSSCKTEDKSTKITAEEILEKSITAYGGQAMVNATITFDVKDLNYTLKRNPTLTYYEVKKEVDTTLSLATYTNGQYAYSVNNKKLEESPIVRRFIASKLEGFAYVLSIPFVLDHNSVNLNRLENVSIKNNTYYTLHVTFTKIDESELTDEFYLYINTESFNIDYMTQRYHLIGKNMIFRKAHNYRTINTIKFADYYNFGPTNDKIKMKDMYRYYIESNLEELEHLNLKNIKVQLD